MIKKLLLLMMLCVSTVVAWAQGTQASKSVYKFTDKAAAGGLYTDNEGNAASVTSGAVCNQNYFIKSEYKKMDLNPSTESITAFGVKTYYVKGADSYTCAYGTAYNADNTYATVTEHELTEGELNAKLSTVLRWTSVAVNAGVQHSELNDAGTYYDHGGATVEEDEICDPDGHYWVLNGDHTGNSLKDWDNGGWPPIKYATSSTSFTSIEGIYTLVDGAYIPLTTTDFDADEHYYTLEFSDLSDVDEAAMAANGENFSTTTTLTGLSDPSGIYYFDGENYTQVSNGNIYHAGSYYIKEESYAEKTPAELLALGYVNAETTYYNCDINISADNKTLTITYHDYSASKSMADYVSDCLSEVNNYPTVAFVSNVPETDYWVLNNMFPGIIDGMSNCTNVKNVVFEQFQGNTNDYSKLNNVTRVILPNGYAFEDSRTGFKKATENTPIYQVYNPTTGKETLDITKPGDLGIIKDYHYYSDYVDNAYWIEIKGNINSLDMPFINGIRNTRLNLSQAQSNGDVDALRTAMHAFENDYVEYLAWPVFPTDPSNPLYTDLYEQCDKLVAVGQYVIPVDENGDAIASETKLVANTKVEGKIIEITDMLGAVTGNNVNIKHAKISGKLNAKDIFHETTSSARGISADGHLYLYPEVDEYASTSQARISVESLDGITDISNATGNHEPTVHTGALSGLYNVVTLDLEDATFSHYEDMTLSKVGIVGAGTESVKLPKTATDVPADFLNVSCKVHEICIPESVERIHARAFYAADLYHVWTTGTDPKVLYDHGCPTVNRTINYDAGGAAINRDVIDGTITFSSNLKFIGSGAFGSVTHVRDIYPLGLVAPECCVDAFSTVTCVANNTLPKVNGSVIRESYMKDDTYAAVLHIPTGVNDVNAKRYTDVTKDFSIVIGERDDKGRYIMYPNQTEFNKAYTDATTGYLWNAQDITRELQEGNGNFYEIQDVVEYRTSSSQADYQTLTDAKYNGKSGTIFYGIGNSNEEIYNKDYRGWHQIVLNDYASSGTVPEKSHDFSGINDNEWWTICVPFDMTKGELLKVFGTSSEKLGGGQPDAYPKVCEFIGVTRKYGVSITLNFSLDHVQNKNGVQGAYVEDNDVVIRAGHPYMIKPALPDHPAPNSRVLKYAEGDANYAKMLDKTDAQLRELVKNEVVVVKKEEGKVTTDNEIADKNCPSSYAFVGTFWKYSMPQYSYFLGWSNSLNNGEGGVCYYYQTGRENLAVRSWNPGTAIILVNWNDETDFNEVTKLETSHWVFNATPEFFTDDSFDQKEQSAPINAVGAKTASHAQMLFDVTVGGEQTTGVNIIHNGSETLTSVVGNIYDLNGRLVQKSGNLNNLSKGVYIIEGKKYVVK